ncbi:hypothetical protein ABT278_29360 [Streptomyces sp. NPDC001228]|uniref:hypothetical protein n=1 Tax=Streptomyces sp. NPDC001228 TaxID=3154381 RepID=UPI00333054C0
MVDEAATIQDKYAGRFASELESNRREQSDLRARLKRLQAEEEVLLRLQNALTSATDGPHSDAGAADAAASEPQATTHTSAVPEEVAVPRPRRKQASRPAAPARKAAGERRPTGGVVKEPAGEKTAAEAAGALTNKSPVDKAAEPSLSELLKQILDRHPGEPHTAAEIAGELEKEYPERTRKVTIVRNTLERLVARSAIERAKQKSTVLYTSHGSATPDGTTAGSSPAVGEESAKAPTA